MRELASGNDDALQVAGDWTTLPLAPGSRSLIEASAGTGKTWTISVLYLRLLLEPAEQGGSPLTPRQIVVATFTDAAAQELRARIRGRLIWAEQCALDVIGDVDWIADDDAAPDLAWLHARWSTDRNIARRDVQRLRLALAELDMAPVTTLHGLCRRILADYPFESGSPFGLGEMVSAMTVLEELADDLWRRLQQGESTPPTFPSTKSRKALVERLRHCLMPGVGLWVPSEEELENASSAESSALIEKFAARNDVWSLTPTGKPSTTLKGAMQALAAWARDRNAMPSAKQFEHLGNRADLLNPEHSAASLEDPAMLEAERLLRLLGYAQSREEIAIWQEWTGQIREWREARLAASGHLTFDDLLTRVHAALTTRGSELADRLFAEWKVALIDEFQDTDAQQYEILDRIYRDAEDRRRGHLIMIGDPKQAIYRFRGGDIDTYLRATQEVQSKLDLATNFRSSRDYVAAVNELFACAGEVLSADPAHAIRFHPVAASGRCDDKPYTTPDDDASKPLVVHYNAEAPVSSAERQQLALEACANQIATMLNNKDHRIGDRRIEPGDIAVLLPTNPQVLALRELLQARNVPCVGAGKSSVFDTDWARELQIALYGVEHASDEAAVRAALASRLGGLDFAQLRALRDEPDAWQVHAARFAELKRCWQSEGVLAVVLAFAQDAATRVADPAARERTLTDLRHLGELLQTQSEQVRGASQLLAWLADQRSGDGDSGGDAADEQQLRIESDAKRVRLMTLHASKGLEFPIVFLPLMWHHGKRSSDTTPVIHEALCGRRVIGFGTEAAAQYDREGQNERFRVLYVALTRAVHACHVYALSPDRPKDGRSSKPLTDPARSALDAVIEKLRDAKGARPLRHVQWLDSDWSWPATIYKPAAVDIEPELSALRTPGATVFEHSWSFSALTRTQASSMREEDPADDETPAAGSVIDEVNSIIEIPDVELSAASNAALLELSTLKGPGFGNALHAMFEDRLQGTPMVEQRRLILNCLNEAGVRLGDLTPTVAIARIAKRLDDVLDAEIIPGMQLGSLSPRQQRAEMAFHFVVDAVSIRRLRDAVARHGDPKLVPSGISTSHLQGLMTGKIDLVFEHEGRFHVLDYKSNHLGDTLAGYSSAALMTAMDGHHYRFQALLYTIAVDRYLRQRITNYRRDTHLGEAIYLFVRAVGLAPALGIWRHRFDDDLLDAVDAVLGNHAAVRAA